MKISEAIKFIVEKNDKKLLTDSKRFKSYLLDLCSDNPKELKIVKRALEDKILERIFGNERDNVKIARLRDEFDEQGMAEDWSEFVISSFAKILGWNYTPKTQNQQVQQNQMDWTCACGTVNNGNFCGNCGKSKPVPKNTSWTCSCGFVNTTKFCGNCGKPNGQQSSEEEARKRAEEARKKVEQEARKKNEEEARKFKNFLLEVINGTQKGQTFDLESDKITIGRRLAPREIKRDWILIGDPSLARIHVFLEWNPEKRLYKAILKATNKNLIINGESVNEGYLYHSDKLQLGDIIFRIWDRQLNKSFIEENNPIQKFETVFILPENIKDINIKSLVREVDNFSLRNAKVGDYIKFGSYPQTTNGEVQPIEWLVLSKEENKMLVISRYGLEARRFDSSSNNWKNSEIRQWLNRDFYNRAFNENEKKNIKPFDGDKVFLLSKEEAEKYFSGDDARKCKPNAYALKNGAYTYDGYCWWWLRSPNGVFVYFVVIGGSFNRNYINRNNGVVRPALWINI